MSKNTFFQQKVSFPVLGNFRCNHYFYSVSWFTLFWMTTLKNTIFIGFFGLFHSFFFFFLFVRFYFSNIKRKNKKCNFFSETSFLTSPKYCKNTILAQCDTICVVKNTPKHYKNGKTVKNLDQFLTLDLDQFLTQETPNLGPVLNSIYIYIHIYVPGRPGCWTMDMNGGSSAPYLACTPCAPVFCTLCNKGGNRRACRLPGAGGDRFCCAVEPSPGHIQCQKQKSEEKREKEK